MIGVMILLIYLIGQVEGLIVTVVKLIIQMGYMNGRIFALERERQIFREAQEPSKANEKTG